MYECRLRLLCILMSNIEREDGRLAVVNEKIMHKMHL